LFSKLTEPSARVLAIASNAAWLIAIRTMVSSPSYWKRPGAGGRGAPGRPSPRLSFAGHERQRYWDALASLAQKT
jgi:hypothetical protein